MTPAGAGRRADVPADLAVEGRLTGAFLLVAILALFGGVVTGGAQALEHAGIDVYPWLAPLIRSYYHGLTVHGVLNVTLMKGDGSAALTTVPANVEARITGLYGAHHSVQLHEERAQGRVSYYGSFRHEPREVLDFEISARPQGGGPRVMLGFRERMGRPETR